MDFSSNTHRCQDLSIEDIVNKNDDDFRGRSLTKLRMAVGDTTYPHLQPLNPNEYFLEKSYFTIEEASNITTNKALSEPAVDYLANFPSIYCL
jgi:hypothetical protein